MSLFLSNLRKQIRKLQKFLKFVKINNLNYSILFNRPLFQYYSIVSLVWFDRSVGTASSSPSRMVPARKSTIRGDFAQLLFLSPFLVRGERHLQFDECDRTYSVSGGYIEWFVVVHRAGE